MINAEQLTPNFHSPEKDLHRDIIPGAIVFLPEARVPLAFVLNELNKDMVTVVSLNVDPEGRPISSPGGIDRANI